MIITERILYFIESENLTWRRDISSATRSTIAIRISRCILPLLILFPFLMNAQERQFSDSTFLLCRTKTSCHLGKDFYSPGCNFQNSVYVSDNTVLFVCGVYKCSEKKYYKVIFKKNEFFIPFEDIYFAKDLDYFEVINNFTDEEKTNFYETAQISALQYDTIKLQEALDFLKACKPKGVGILNWNTYDESEYTNGIGVNIEIYNPTNKTIKYFWLNIVGYNPVGDRVINRRTNTSNIQLKGVGPIMRDRSNKYRFEYVWFTDLVETAKITSIKVQYMDGTVKTILSPSSVTLHKELYEYALE